MANGAVTAARCAGIVTAGLGAAAVVDDAGGGLDAGSEALETEPSMATRSSDRSSSSLSPAAVPSPLRARPLNWAAPRLLMVGFAPARTFSAPLPLSRAGSDVRRQPHGRFLSI